MALLMAPLKHALSASHTANLYAEFAAELHVTAERT
jgi:hypothetical protein